MKGIKKKWLPAAFGLMAGMALSLPTEAVVVPIETTSSTNIIGIGADPDSGSSYDQVGFFGGPVNPSPDLTPNIVSPMTEITLGHVTFLVDQNCIGACTTTSVPGTLQFTITSLGETKTVDLGFTWSNSPRTDGPDSRSNGTLVFNSFTPTPLVFTSGFESLVMELLKPQPFIVATGVTDPDQTNLNIKANVYLIIPEPSSLPLLGIGLLAFGLNRRSRAKAGQL